MGFDFKQLKKMPSKSQQMCLNTMLTSLSLLAVLPTGAGKTESLFMFAEMASLVRNLSVF